ncbi:MAG: hypothetical protein HY211_06535 [Candidatus Omnitrophica bacterium]|nr:hypothetical protein [Candidatus Omnitrophota bacterium]
MLARKIILGFGFAVLLPMLIHQGIELVSPRLDYKRYQIENYHQKYKQASTEEQAQLEAEKHRMAEKWDADQKRDSRIHFFVGVPLGIAVVLLGSFLKVQAVGGGLMLGGIFTFMEGCGWYWWNLDQLGRFLVLLTAFAVLLWIGYKRFSELKQPKQSIV